MAADMLAAYYSYGENTQALFDELKIAQADSYQTHLNQYNVLKIDMQEFLSMTNDIEKMLEMIKSYLISDLVEQYPEAKFKDRNNFIQVCKDIYLLTKRPFIILIDEWDCLFREYRDNKEAQKRYLDFLRAWLKDKAYVAAEYFGFTEAEVQELCQEYGMSFEEAKAWYDGYGLISNNQDGIVVHSCTSMVEAMLRHKFGTYWNQTKTYEALRIYIQMNYDGLKDSIIKMLAGSPVKINTGTFSNDMTTFTGKDDVLTLLIHLGYLTYDWKNKTVTIPNKEVSQEYVNAISTMNWPEVIRSVEASHQLLQALWDLDGEAVATGIDRSHQEMGRGCGQILGLQKERSL